MAGAFRIVAVRTLTAAEQVASIASMKRGAPRAEREQAVVDLLAIHVAAERPPAFRSAREEAAWDRRAYAERRAWVRGELAPMLGLTPDQATAIVRERAWGYFGIQTPPPSLMTAAAARASRAAMSRDELQLQLADEFLADLHGRPRPHATTAQRRGSLPSATRDEAWAARQVAHASPAVRTAVLATLVAARAAREPLPAVRSAVDEAWVAAQLSKRRAYIRDVLAPLLGLRADEAERALLSGAPKLISLGRLAI